VHRSQGTCCKYIGFAFASCSEVLKSQNKFQSFHESILENNISFFLRNVVQACCFETLVPRSTMRFSTFGFLVVAVASTCTALPTNLTNFLLVTTAQPKPSANSSDLKAVSATSLFVCSLVVCLKSLFAKYYHRIHSTNQPFSFV
jgi:hypothetical protein